jgi:hypothetical protein
MLKKIVGLVILIHFHVPFVLHLYFRLLSLDHQSIEYIGLSSFAASRPLPSISSVALS